MNTFDQAGPAPRVGIIELPDLAAVLGSLGVGVVSGSTFREAATNAKAASAASSRPLPLIVGDRPTGADGRPAPGINAWAKKMSAQQPVIVIRNHSEQILSVDGAAEITLPTTVNTILATAGLPPVANDVQYPAPAAAQPAPVSEFTSSPAPAAASDDDFFSVPAAQSPAQPAAEDDFFAAPAQGAAFEAPATNSSSDFFAAPAQGAAFEAPAATSSSDFFAAPAQQAQAPQAPAAPAPQDDFFSAPAANPSFEAPAPVAQTAPDFYAAPQAQQAPVFGAPTQAAPQTPANDFYAAPQAAPVFEAPSAQQTAPAFPAPAQQAPANDFYAAPQAQAAPVFEAPVFEAPAAQPAPDFYAAPQAQQAPVYEAPAAQPAPDFYAAPQAQQAPDFYAAPQAQAAPVYEAPAFQAAPQPAANEFYAAPQAQQAPVFEAPAAQPAPDFYAAPQAQQAPAFQAAPQAQAAPVYEAPPFQAAPQPAANEFYAAPQAQQAPVQQTPVFEAPAVQQAPDFYAAPQAQQAPAFQAAPQAPANDFYGQAPQAAQAPAAQSMPDFYSQAPAAPGMPGPSFDAPAAQGFYGGPAQPAQAAAAPAAPQDFYGAPAAPAAGEFFNAPVQAQQAPADSFYGAPAAQPTAPVGSFQEAPAQMQAPDDVMAGFDTYQAARKRSAGRSTSDLANVICVVAGKGGVGKTTTAMALAQIAAEAGLRVILIDANSGQADLRTYMRIANSDLPTIYDAAIGRDSAIIGPAALNSVRRPEQGKVSFGFVAGPPHDEDVDQSLVTNQVYNKVIHEARQKSDLVILDTQIIEATDRNRAVADIIQPLLVESAFALAIADMTSAGVKRLNERLPVLINRGVPRDRLMVMINNVPQDQMAVADNGSRYFGNLGTFVGAIPTNVPEIHDAMNSGNLPSDNTELRTVLTTVLERVTGADMFRVPAEQESAAGPKSGILSRMFGKKKAA